MYCTEGVGTLSCLVWQKSDSSHCLKSSLIDIFYTRVFHISLKSQQLICPAAVCELSDSNTTFTLTCSRAFLLMLSWSYVMSFTVKYFWVDQIFTIHSDAIARVVKSSIWRPPLGNKLPDRLGCNPVLWTAVLTERTSETRWERCVVEKKWDEMTNHLAFFCRNFYILCMQNYLGVWKKNAVQMFYWCWNEVSKLMTFIMMHPGQICFYFISF